MNLTKEQFKTYLLDVKGYDEGEVTEMLQTMKEEGTPIQEMLSESELVECEAYVG